MEDISERHRHRYEFNNAYRQQFQANGMQVVVIPDHRAPVVPQMLWFKVGAVDDPLLPVGELVRLLELDVEVSTNPFDRQVVLARRKR